MTDALVLPVRPFAEYGDSDYQPSRRCSPRVTGPFDGRRIGTVTAPIRIHDLSIGGCLIESNDQVRLGLGIAIQIDLPGEGWISVDAETLYVRANFGFAATFITLSRANRGRIERTIERLMVERSRQNWTLGEF
jgi:hypothetical protein